MLCDFFFYLCHCFQRQITVITRHTYELITPISGYQTCLQHLCISSCQIAEDFISYFLPVTAVDQFEIPDVSNYKMNFLPRSGFHKRFCMIEKRLSGINSGELIMFYCSQCHYRLPQLDHTVDPAHYKLKVIGLRNKINCTKIQALEFCIF